ncbi:hypothetical protein GOB94_08010 [Granulicella sp. 5B5]|uniref:hypothetical protein n=1 Tax=Granulicella sp. 5B5 TaxID=1617967 RepID=UPI0015F4455E|nr:hypothetical protein [Granulicella sp. 5B5]QMV18634.1 hypothetical protein GOB94_08010 [Granulicella sp. 5B5]
MKPYVDIKDLNFPGAYFLDAFVMCALGAAGGGERIYDLLLCAAAGIGFILGVGRTRWAHVAGMIAGSLLLLIHLQDGLAQEGQRDFAMAVLAVLACSFYLRLQKRRIVALIAYELLVGCIFILKPTLALMFLVPLVATCFDEERPSAGQVAGASVVSALIAPMLAWFWLMHEHAGKAFLDNLRTIGTMHAELPRRGILYLCVHAGSPVAAFFVLWIAFAIVNGRWRSPERIVTGLAVLCGFTSYLAQGKGLPYQRYPFLALLLLALFVEIERARTRSKQGTLTALAIYAVVALWLCPGMLRKIRSFEAVAPLETALSSQLEMLGVKRDSSVQCVDTFNGCLTTLYEMGVVQSSGYLYDCYLFQGGGALQAQYRDAYLADLKRRRPQFVVVIDQNCFVPDPGFRRLQQWPEFSDFLSKQYSLRTISVSSQEYLLWNRRERRPGFEVYSLR